MFTINLFEAEKRYPSGTVFSGLNFLFESGNVYALTGHNGSGKSTLLKIIAGCSQLSSGDLQHAHHGHVINEEDIAQYVSICAPWLDLPDELTADELFKFHTAFNPMLVADGETFFEKAHLSHARNKVLKTFSTGMVQRMKLALAILTRKNVLLLDEPGSNLDTQGLSLLHAMVKEYAGNRLIIVSGNTEAEISMGNKPLDLQQFIPKRQ